MIYTWNDTLASMPSEFISLSKPKRVIEASMYSEDQRVLSEPVTRDELLTVHDPKYVDDVLQLRAKNGFGGIEQRVLDHVLAANGAMMEAARLALKNPGHPVLAPVSGFHHAGYAWGHGYCTFNGLALAARQANGGRVLILDGDGHYGDGTDSVLNTLRNQGMRWAANVMNVTRMTRTTWYHKIFNALRAGRWDLIIYQAGADAHEADPYGVGYLTDTDWRSRDELVFGAAMQSRTPIVWNLAGGYNGLETYRLHAETAATARLYSELLKRRDAAPAAELQA